MKISFLSVILLLNVACNYVSVDDVKLQALSPTAVSPTVSASPEESIKVSKEMVYSLVLSSAAYGRDVYDVSAKKYNHTNWFDPRAIGNWLAVKKQTVAPENPDEIKSFTDLPADLVDDFVEKVKTGEKLNDDYDVKFGIDVLDLKGDLDSVFKVQERKGKTRDKDLTLKAIVGVSRVGFNKTHSQSLVYVEFYHPVTGLQKKYCLTTWKRDGEGIIVEKVKFFQ